MQALLLSQRLPDLAVGRIGRLGQPLVRPCAVHNLFSEGEGGAKRKSTLHVCVAARAAAPYFHPKCTDHLTMHRHDTN